MLSYILKIYVFKLHILKLLFEIALFKIANPNKLLSVKLYVFVYLFIFVSLDPKQKILILPLCGGGMICHLDIIGLIFYFVGSEVGYII
jgi:hypothetical protein